MCVQRFDDSLNSAIHITYRISLRSSSMPEPRDPLLKVFVYSRMSSDFTFIPGLLRGDPGGPRGVIAGLRSHWVGGRAARGTP